METARRPTVFFNGERTNVDTTLGVLSFHRRMLAALTEFADVYFVQDRLAADSSTAVRQGWGFVKEFVSLSRAAKLAPQTELAIELCAHHFQPPQLDIANINCIHDLHAFDLPWKYADAHRNMLRQALCECRAVVTMFPRTYFDIERVIGRSVTNLFLLEAPLLVKPARGIETARGKTEVPQLLYPAQFQVHKNHMGLLKGLRAYFDCGKEAKFVFTGSDFASDKVPLRMEIQHEADRLGLSHYVNVAGKVEENELTDLYGACDGMIVGSLAEGGAYVPLEGIYAGLPVALHDLRSSRMHIEMHGAEVRYFDSTDPESVAGAIAWLATANRSRLAEVNEPTRDSIDARSWHSVAAAMMRIIDWVVGNKSRPVMSLAPGSAEVRLQ